MFGFGWSQSPVGQSRDFLLLFLGLARRCRLRLRALHPAHSCAVSASDLHELAGESLLDEIVPAFVLGLIPLALPAADVEAVARARHGDVEEPVIFLALGLLEASLGIRQCRKVGVACWRPDEVLNLAG